MIQGVVQGGVVLLDTPAELADGTRVTVVPTTPATNGVSKGSSSDDTAKMLLKYVGVADALPDDMARNHDHYLHGRDKQ